jgi:hypothetical protein
MKRKRNIFGILFIILFSLFFYFVLGWLGNDPKPYLGGVAMDFQGTIIRKYEYHGTHLKIEIKKGIIDISHLSDSLTKNSLVGDSLIKIENSNCCKLIRNSQVSLLEYMYIPEQVLKRSEPLRKLYIINCRIK